MGKSRPNSAPVPTLGTAAPGIHRDGRPDDAIPVWDPLVRIVHWSLVAAFVVAYVTQTGNYDRHLQAGYAIGGLVAIRLVWGFAGSRHARFADFLYAPRHILLDLKGAFSGGRRRYLGHNPAGGAMILALLLGLVVLVISGIALDAAENQAGPLGQTMLYRHTPIISKVHVWTTNGMLVLIAAHLAGVLSSSLAHRENLVRAMITGRKRRGIS